MRLRDLNILMLFGIFLFWGKESVAVKLPPTDNFSTHVAKVEASYGIPRGLHSAISKVESGRWIEDQRKIVAWPWSINVQGEGRFFEDKATAVAAVKKLKAQGIKSIDVGPMQVNLHHHKDAFPSIDRAFDPKSNVEYAAQFLKSLKDSHGSWAKAVAHYHSATPALHIPYYQKVHKMWQQERKQGLGDPWGSANWRTESGPDSSWFRTPHYRIIRVKSLPKARAYSWQGRADLARHRDKVQANLNVMPKRSQVQPRLQRVSFGKWTSQGDNPRLKIVRRLGKTRILQPKQRVER